MGRNKRKSKATARAASESDEDNGEAREAAADVTAPCEGSEDIGKDTSPETPRQDDGDNSEHEDGAPRKKKEYRGNRLKKLEKCQKGKGDVAAAAEKIQAEGAADDAGGAAAPQDTRVPPVQVLYCPHCSFPAEFCAFGGMMDKCRQWLLEHNVELADTEDRGRKRRILTEKERLEALLEGRGIKHALERVVVMDVENRVGKRTITSVFGMDLFGFNLKDLSRDWRKRFSCGAGVRSAEEGKYQSCIDIQGNVAGELAELLVSKYSIPKSAVFMMVNKKKVPYPY
ncbi:hypothetical protein ABL78_1591 [Leptomonas seymouri]|uniref:SUI1 domain-containing protein n=1 Tax=Leptomonas seymouri TaxID=5684 RepID=A0A0N1IAD2_LEPSE|nr:hypothetical protein ABL78_1591 [Leptomonas seymouri]|eukprot:KPI89258.1 hypothetical protein ABL78_1591 [Leptomonas seymouri]